jgi:hypothetical protein
MLLIFPRRYRTYLPIAVRQSPKEERMPSKLAPHCVPEHMDFGGLDRWQPPSIKLVGFDAERCRRAHEAAPNALFVLRDHPLSEQHDDMFRDPAGTGERHAFELAAMVERSRGPIPLNQIVVTGINEPHVWDAGGVAATVAYTVAFLDRLRELGLRGGALNLSVGWPANTGPDTPPDWTGFAPVEAAIKRGNHFLVLHEYWDARGPDYNWGWWAGRYTKCPWQVPIIIGECGIDRYVSDPSVGLERRGWNGNVMPDAYMAQLARYDELLRADQRIHSAQIFTFDFAHPWESFDVRPIRDRLIAHAEALRGVADPVPPPPAEPPIVVTPGQGVRSIVPLLEAEFGEAFTDLRGQLPVHSTLVYPVRPLNAIDMMVVHHSDTPQTTTWQAIAQWHTSHNNWPGIGYHIGIEPSGRVILLNDIVTHAYHVGDVNRRSIGVCVLGDYRTVEPSPAVIDALRRLLPVLDYYCGNMLMAKGHSDVNPTQCPGAKLLAHVKAIRQTAPQPDIRDLIRAEAWKLAGIPLNADSAFIRKARAEGLGAPLGPERDTGGWRWQPFAGGIVGCPIDRWDEVEVLNW